MICTKCAFDNPGENTNCRVCEAPLGANSVSVTEADAAVTTGATSRFATADDSETNGECPNHPGVIAAVICDNCQGSFCDKCVAKADPSGFHLCASCFLSAVEGAEFCAECAADLKYVEFVSKGDDVSCFGKTEPCPTCNSVVRTRWAFLVFFPFFPLASYRFREGVFVDTEEEETRHIYQRGRTRMRWSQVLRTLLIFYGSIAAIILIVFVITRFSL